MKPMRIELSQGQFTEVPDGGLRGYRFLIQWKWYAHWNPGTKSFYAVRTEVVDGVKQTIWMHRVIKNAHEGVLVDHHDHDTLNNRWRNLRFASYAQNNRNARTRKDNRSGHRGVHWHKANRRWIAMIRVNKVRLYLGSYKSKQRAIAIYQAAAKRLHGKFRFEANS